jgi:hypothetical protein
MFHTLIGRLLRSLLVAQPQVSVSGRDSNLSAGRRFEWTFWVCRFVDTLYKSPAEKNWVNTTKSGLLITEFSHRGLFRIRVSTLYSSIINLWTWIDLATSCGNYLISWQLSERETGHNSISTSGGTAVKLQWPKGKSFGRIRLGVPEHLFFGSWTVLQIRRENFQ